MRKTYNIHSHKRSAEKLINYFIKTGCFPKCYPEQLQLDLTNSCNENCQYCSFPSKNKKHFNKELSINSVINFLRHFEKNGGKTVFVTGGGDPGKYSKIKEFFEYFYNSKLLLSMNTNGYILQWLINCIENNIVDFTKVWSSKKPSVISISLHNKKTLEDVKKFSVFRNEKVLNVKIRVTFLINEQTTINEVRELISQIKNADADIISPKPLHKGTNYIGLNGEIGQRVFKKNVKVYRYLLDLQKKLDYLKPVRIERLSGKFIQFEDLNDKLVRANKICFAPFARIVVNAMQEYSICCTAKLPGIGTGEKYFPCGKALEPSVYNYYYNVLFGMINFNPFYCIRGCDYLELNNKYNKINSPVVKLIRELRKNNIAEVKK